MWRKNVTGCDYLYKHVSKTGSGWYCKWLCPLQVIITGVLIGSKGHQISFRKHSCDFGPRVGLPSKEPHHLIKLSLVLPLAAINLQLDHVKEDVRANQIVLTFAHYLLIQFDFLRLNCFHLNVGAVHTAHVLNLKVPLWPQVHQYHSLNISG